MNALPWAEFWYNSSYHYSIETTPFQAVYGRPPPEIVDYRTGDSVVEEALTKRKKLLETLKRNLQSAQERMKKYADCKRRFLEFAVDDWVWLKIQPYW